MCCEIPVCEKVKEYITGNFVNVLREINMVYLCRKARVYHIFLFGGGVMGNEILLMIISAGISAVTGVIGYFLRATMHRVDSAEDKLQALELSRPEKAELAEIKDDLKELNDKFATKEEVREVKEAMNKITKDIDFIKEKTVRNDEFIRVIARLEGKMDELLRR